MDVVISLPPNPSHLEAVDPIVEGMARAAGTLVDAPGAASFDPTRSLPILIHGDAAFPGQGVVAETLNLGRLPGYQTGRHDPHHRQQPARVHHRAGRRVQHVVCERPRARVQDPDRARQRRRPGSVRRGGAAGGGVPRAIPARLPDRPDWLPATWAQRRGRARVHAAAHVPEDHRPPDGPRDSGRRTLEERGEIPAGPRRRARPEAHRGAAAIDGRAAGRSATTSSPSRRRAPPGAAAKVETAVADRPAA